MKYPILYSFKRCPYAMRARMALQLTNIKCEIREVRLNNKPKHMLEVSPKGTVPVLILNDRTIEESMEVIDWALNQKNVFEGNLKENQIKISNDLIERFDDKFKYQFLLNNKFSVFFGKISYSLYIWHFPIFSFYRISKNNFDDNISDIGLPLISLNSPFFA